MFCDASKEPDDTSTSAIAIPDDAAVCMYLKEGQSDDFEEWVDRHSKPESEYLCLELCKDVKNHGKVKFVFKKRITT